MELFSTSDVYFIQAALAAAACYGVRRLASLSARKKVEPLIPPRTESTKSPTNAITSSTRSINKRLQLSQKSGVFFYGSQTGTAEKLASIMAKDAQSRFGIDSILADIDDFDFDDLLLLPKDKFVVFVLATYGEGEPTDSSIAFDRYCGNIALQDVASSATLNYSIFGLGNSSYQFYNEMAKRTDNALTSVGALRIGSLGLGDDGLGNVEKEFLDWKEITLPLLAKQVGLVEHEPVYTPAFSVEEPSPQLNLDIFLGEPNAAHRKGKIRGPYTIKNPFPGRIVKSQQLFKSGNRQCLHIEFDISGSTIAYETGDHLAVWPENSNIEVERFLRVFGLSGKKDSVFQVVNIDQTAKISVPACSSYDAVARYYLDICAPISRHLLVTLAAHISDESTRSELLRLSTDSIAFEKEVRCRHLNIAQLLESLNNPEQWISLPATLLFEQLGKLQPRYYSISSSSIHSKRQISITAIVQSKKDTDWIHDFKGVASNYLLAQHSKLQCRSVGDSPELETTPTHQLQGPRYRDAENVSLIHVRKSKFRLPKKNATPIIMIGPGTGVAPFRAFVQERAVQNKFQPAGRMMLFYGCRRRDEDFLYEEEWEELKESFEQGTFSMHVACSREIPGEKIYVQHLLEEHETEMRALIMEQDACVYVCGDAKQMAKDVFKTMVNLIARSHQFRGNVQDAEIYLKDLKKNNRWLEDVW